MTDKLNDGISVKLKEAFSNIRVDMIEFNNSIDFLKTAVVKLKKDNDMFKEKINEIVDFVEKRANSNFQPSEDEQDFEDIDEMEKSQKEQGVEAEPVDDDVMDVYSEEGEESDDDNLVGDVPPSIKNAINKSKQSKKKSSVKVSKTKDSSESFYKGIKG